LRRGGCACDWSEVCVFLRMEEWRTVATLNMKNLPDDLYGKLKARARRERRPVAQKVNGLLAAALDSPKGLSIMDLPGLGSGLSRGVDAAGHVETERASWD
jgi:plasmid stability protein